MRRCLMVRLIAAVLACLGWVAPAAAEITVREAVVYYDVDAVTLSDLRAQMKTRGPRGYWGYARWNVKADRDCDVTLRVTYTLPRHVAPDGMADLDRAKWEAMIAVLEQHERNHGAHGLAAAKEVKAANCVGTWRIIRKWAEQDRIYDRQTDHGRKEGVVLK